MILLVSPEAATGIRYAYMALSMLVAALLAGLLVVRWGRLDTGERIVRIGIIGEHITFVYGGYLALSNHLPATDALVWFTVWLIGIVLGFALWGISVKSHRRNEAEEL